jgi:hypothetical protein
VDQSYSNIFDEGSCSAHIARPRFPCTFSSSGRNVRMVVAGKPMTSKSS